MGELEKNEITRMSKKEGSKRGVKERKGEIESIKTRERREIEEEGRTN